MKDNFCL